MIRETQKTEEASAIEPEQPFLRLVSTTKHVGYIYAEAREGDLLVPIDYPNNTGTSHIVMRNSQKARDNNDFKTYDVAGQGMLQPGFSIKRPNREHPMLGDYPSFWSHALLKVTVLDVVLLAAYNTPESSEVDVKALRSRVSMNPFTYPKGAVKLCPGFIIQCPYERYFEE